MLIAGTTGSGKSVCTNSLIISLLYKSTPDEVRFIMVDPKMVELAPYNGIPHLLIPVVTDPKKAAGALQWAVYEMMKRYKLFSENGVKDLAGFNALAQRNEELDDKDNEGRYIRQERATGSCARSFYVGKELEPKDISAKFENGILTLHLPKAEAKKLEPKQTLIEIE